MNASFRYFRCMLFSLYALRLLRFALFAIFAWAKKSPSVQSENTVNYTAKVASITKSETSVTAKAGACTVEQPPYAC